MQNRKRRQEAGLHADLPMLPVLYGDSRQAKCSETELSLGMREENSMKAVLLNSITPAEQVTLSEIGIPEVRSGWVLIKVKAFGMNHSEKILRLHEIENAYIQKPIIPGIECVGEIVHPSDSHFEKGQKVVALMGGMGRAFHGSYAEYALLPAHHVFEADTSLSWKELGAVPETYFTAWGSLFECLNLTQEDVLLIRGGTCALGYAAMQMAKAIGSKVIATTHKKSKLPLLKGADEAVLDTGKLQDQICGVTKALELVGAKTLHDTMRCMEKGGIVCHTGILGGVYALNGFDPIKFIPNGVYLTGFYSNAPTQEVMNDIFSFIHEDNLHPCVGAEFDFSEIKEACAALDSGNVNGKIVVTMT